MKKNEIGNLLVYNGTSGSLSFYPDSCLFLVVNESTGWSGKSVIDVVTIKLDEYLDTNIDVVGVTLDSCLNEFFDDCDVISVPGED